MRKKRDEETGTRSKSTGTTKPTKPMKPLKPRKSMESTRAEAMRLIRNAPVTPALDPEEDEQLRREIEKTFEGLRKRK